MSNESRDGTENAQRSIYDEARDESHEVNAPDMVDPFDGWHFLGERKYLSEPPKPRRWLLMRDQGDLHRDTNSPDKFEGVLPLGKVGMLAAAGGVGKTMALCQLALAVATGCDWFGLKIPEKSRGRVLLALAEEDAEEVHRRIFNAAKAMRLSKEQGELAGNRIAALPLAGKPVALVQNDERGNVTESPALEFLRRRLRANAAVSDEWKLLVLDPLSRWAGADTEKDNAAATRFIQVVETLVEMPGTPTVLLAHHTSKAARKDPSQDDATAARGASGLVDGVRWVSNLENVRAPDDSRNDALLSFSKSNYGPLAPRLWLERDNANGGALCLMTNEHVAEHLAAKTAKLVKKKNGAIATSNSERRLSGFEDDEDA